MIYKGLIISFDGNKAIVITDDRQYLRVRRENGMYIGQRITFDAKTVITGTIAPAKFIYIAACIFILFSIIILSGPINQFMISSKEYAFVDIDINPSIEFVLDKDRKVLKVVPLNNDAKSFASDSVLTGKHADESIKILLEKFGKSGLIKDGRILLVSASLKHEEDGEKLDNLINSLKSSIRALNNNRLKIVTVKAKSGDIIESRKRKISIGKNVLINNIIAMESNINVEKISNMPLSDIMQMYWKIAGNESSNDDIENMDSKNTQTTASKPESTYNSGKNSTETIIPQNTVAQNATQNTKIPTPTAIPKVISTPKASAKVNPNVTPTPIDNKGVETSLPEPTMILNGIVAGKYYRITAKHSGKVISVVDSSMKEGANIVQKTYVGADSQLWKIEPVKEGYYKITSKHSGKCLSVKDSGLNNGVGLVQMNYTGKDNQLFSFDEVTPGYYAIFVKHTGKCADVVAKYKGEDVTVWQWDYLGGDNQKWKISDD
ncbi:MAG: RICIN domain-containing protein [Bacillota bacterium]|nr:RICIN domain-containing protein [Bacillota bacterium]